MSPGKGLQLRTSPMLISVGEEALVEVLATGVCHTDVHIPSGADVIELRAELIELARSGRLELATEVRPLAQVNDAPAEVEPYANAKRAVLAP